MSPTRANFLLPLLLFSTLPAFGAGSTGSVTITGTAEVGQTLSASNNLADADGLGAITYQWYRDGEPIMYGGTLKDGVNGVDGLDGANGVTISSDDKHVYVTGREDNTTTWFERNSTTGALTYGGMLKDGVNGVDGLDGANGVTISPDGKHAYVTGSADDAVSWHERNGSTGALTYGGMLKDGVGGVDGLDGALGVTLSADGKHAYVTGSQESAVAWFERNASTGALTYGGMLKDGLNGVDGLAYANGITLSADGKHAYVTGSNDNGVSWYARNVSTGALSYGGVLKYGVNGVQGLLGAFEVTLSADGKHAYVTGFDNDAVSWYERNASTGALTYGGVLNNGVNGVSGLLWAYGITLSADGKHAYVTGYWDLAVSWYERNASTGALTFGGVLVDGANGVDGLNGAYDVTLSADGKHAYVTGAMDDAVSWFERNASTGALTYFIANQSTYVLKPADAGSIITVVASYVDGATNPVSVSSAGTQPVNTVPVITTPSSASVAENQTLALDVNATDGDGDGLTYSLAGGVDQAKFDINPSSGVLTFKTASDFEANASAANDNVYLVTVQVTDGTSPITQAITVNVTNANDPTTGSVTISGTAEIGQTLTASNTLADADGLGTITYQWYRNGQPILYGGTLKDGVNGVDGLEGNIHLTLSGDGKHAYYVSITDDSVNWFEINASTGALTYRGVLKDNLNGVDGLDYASWLAISNDGKQVYVTGYNDDAVSWYDRNASTGALTFSGMLKDGANGVDGLNGAWRGTFASDGKYLYLAGWLDNSVSWFERNATTGALSYLGMVKDGVNGVDGLAGAQNVKLSLDGKHAYVTGIDDHAVSWFDRNGTTGILTYGGTLKDGVNGVDGLEKARNLTLSPDGLFLYVTAENDDAVSWYERNASTGALTYLGHLKDGVGGIDNLDYPWKVTLSSDGAFAYVDSIYENAITWFERNASTGALSYKGHVKEGVKGVDGLHGAGTLVLSGNGLHAYSGGHMGDTAIWFARDPVTGALSYAQTGTSYVLTPSDLGSVITVVASYVDGATNPESVTSAGTVPVQYPNQSPAFTSFATANAPENQAIAIDVNASDPDGDVLTYSIVGGADQAKFDLNPATGLLTFKTAPDFESPGSAAGNNSYTVTVRVSDGPFQIDQAITVTVTNQNDAPVFTATSSAYASENQTFILDLNATDPDGDFLNYSITGGADESSFGLNPNTGVLIFIIIPDFENPADADLDNSYELTVQVSDGSLVTTQALQVRVTDLFRPIVETGLAESLTGSAATLKGEIVDNGGLTVLDRGILFSIDPDPKLGKAGVTNLAAGQGTGAFSAQATGLEPGRKYYFRAYAKNGEGTSYGSDGEFVTLFDGKNPGWIEATPGEATDWWTSPWLGSFFLSPNGWAMHGELGWVYPVESPTAGIWLWKDGLGWLWTDDGVYPFLYGAGGTGWLYFFGQHEGTRLFYDYGKREWKTLE